jgi:glycosyltransferase involved in cell wall biosynthesis
VILLARIIEEINCGILVPASDPQSHVNAIIYLLKNPELCNDMGLQGRKAILEKYNWTTQEQVLFNLYNKACLTCKI